MIFIFGIASLVTTFLFGTVVADSLEYCDTASQYNVTNVWENSHQDDDSSACKCRPAWADGNQKYYDDIIEAFNKFPGTLKNTSDLVKCTFQDYLTRVVSYTNSDSIVLSSSSTAILDLLSKVDIQIGSPEGVIQEFCRMLPIFMGGYREIVSNLSEIIGKAAGRVIKALRDLEREYEQYTREFLRDNGSGLRNEADYEPITKRAAKLNEAVAVARSEKCVHPDCLNALTALNLVLEHVVICYNGLNGCCQAVLYEQRNRKSASRVT